MSKLMEASATVAHRVYFNTPKKVIAVCLLLFLTVQVQQISAVDAGCDFSQDLKPGSTHYVYNPNYPDYSVGRHSCRWRATSSYTIRLSCKSELARSYRCWRARITVSIDNNVARTYCGYDSFTEESESGEMVINFNQVFWDRSRFICSLEAIAPPQQNCKCGWKNPSRIVGGMETGVNEYPMMAGIVDFLNRDIRCGGTIISEKYVLTAAHCLASFAQNITGVVVGEHDITTGNDTKATQLLRVADWIIHPLYNKSSTAYSFDIAIIEVLGKINFNIKVGPVCLPFQLSNTLFTGANVTILGWGTIEFAGPKSDTLQKASVEVSTPEECHQAYSTATNKELCTYAPGRDSCQFDSGGPVLWNDRRTGNLVLVGVITAGLACATDTPAINQRVGAYMDWIVNVTSKGAQYCRVE